MIEITKENAERAGYSVYPRVSHSQHQAYDFSYPGKAAMQSNIFYSPADAWAAALGHFRQEVERAAQLTALDRPPPVQPVPLESDGWSYNVQTAEVIDANGLRVARDVLPEDAPLIVYATRLRKAAAALIESREYEADTGVMGWGAMEEVLDAIAAHEQQSVPRAQGCRLPAAETPMMALLLFEALEHRRDAFDGDEEINGGDLVEWFSEWRQRAEIALAGQRAPGLGRVILQAHAAGILLDGLQRARDGRDDGLDLEEVGAAERRAVDLLKGREDLIRRQDPSMAMALAQAAIWFKEYADGHEAKGAMEKALRNRARARACELAAVAPGKLRIGVTLDGGLVQGVFSTAHVPGVEVVVIDYDTDGSQNDELMEVRQVGEDRWTKAIVSHWAVDEEPDCDFDRDFREIEAGEDDGD